MVLLIQEAETEQDCEVRLHVLGSKVTQRTPPSGAFEVTSRGETTAHSQHSVKILLQALYTISPVKIIFIKEKWLQYSSAKRQLPLHLNRGAMKRKL